MKIKQFKKMFRDVLNNAVNIGRYLHIVSFVLLIISYLLDSINYVLYNTYIGIEFILCISMTILYTYGILRILCALLY